jgi:iron complex outermembrane recepter protein
MTTPIPLLVRGIFRILVAALLASTLAASESPREFNIAAGKADVALRQFTAQSGLEVLFGTATTSNVRTREVKGVMPPRVALEQLLADTGLIVIANERTGALTIARDPNVQRAAPASAARNTTPAVEGGTLQLDRLTVTGSRIPRLEREGPQPTAAYSDRDIADRGFLNLGDFVQSLSFNNGTSNSIGVPAANPVSSVPFARGAVTMNPRGLGANRFLVLIDGKRPAAYGLADNRGGSVFDFNSIPPEAIESIEYLKDGASAIYGSDAIAGVMNIRLKSSYEGMAATALVGNTLGHDSLTRSLSVLAGGRSDRGSYLVHLNWFAQNGNFATDYDRSQTTDYSHFGAPRGQNNNSNSVWPFNLTLTAAQATAAGFSGGAGGYVITGGLPTATPTRASFSRAGANLNAVTNANRYDFAPATQLTPDQENLSALINVKHRVSDRLTASAQVLVNRNTTDIIYTPISINSRSVRNADNSFLTIPVNNPFNPFGFALDDFRGRGNFGPLRTFDVESTNLTLIAGADAEFGNGWTGSATLIRGEGVVDQLAGNQIRTSDMQAALNGTLAGFNGRFFNPFGPSDQALLDALFVTSTSNSKSTTTGVEVSAAGNLFAMPGLLGGESAGDVGLAVGAEWRRDQLDNNSDPVGYLVTVGDLPYAGSRTVTSAYAEAVVPVLPRYLTLQLAGRFDEYDSFGSTVNPKFALISRPTNFLSLRASFSRSFKAPEIGQIYQPAITTFTTAISDPLNPGLGLNTYPFIASGNRNLEPEKGRVRYGGVVVDLGRFVRGLSVSADYFDIEISNVITTFTNPATFFTLFPNRVVRGAGGTIQYFDASTINAAGYQWSGADFAVDYVRASTPVGDLALNLQLTYTDVFALDAGSGAGPVNTAGRYNTPRVTGSGQLGWRRGDWSASLGALHKGSYLMDQFAPAWPEGAETLYNASVSFEGWKGARFTIGCNNLLDDDPPQNGRAIPSYGFDIATYSAWSMGRFVYLKVRTEF